MLDNILDLVKDQVVKSISGNVEIPADKQEQAVDTTASSIIDGFKSQITPGNMGEIMNLFGGGNSGAGSPGNSTIAQGVQSTVVSALTSKVGLNQGLATTIAGIVVPAVMGMFSKKVNDDNEPGFNIGSLIDTFTGGGNNSGGSGKSSGMLGSIVSVVGRLFGKK